jgi:hypothetical protein
MLSRGLLNIWLGKSRLHETALDLNKVGPAWRLPGGQTVTVSIGVASCEEKTGTYRDFVEKADAALYQAKRSGKNRLVVVANGEVGSDVKGTEKVLQGMWHLPCLSSSCSLLSTLLYSG